MTGIEKNPATTPMPKRNNINKLSKISTSIIKKRNKKNHTCDATTKTHVTIKARKSHSHVTI